VAYPHQTACDLHTKKHNWCSVVHNGRMNTKTLPPPKRRSYTRTSIPVDNATLEVFKRLAKAGGTSTGKAMADWLKDTVDAAELMASTMERARAAPKIVTAELHAMMLGMTDLTKEMQDKYASFRGPLDGGGATSAPARGGATLGDGSRNSSPPPCNTGGKVPPKAQKTGQQWVYPLPSAHIQAHANTNGIPPKGGV